MNFKLSRRKVLLLGISAAFSTVTPAVAQKKRNRRNLPPIRRGQRLRDLPDSTPTSTPTPTPPPQPEPYKPPHPALFPAIGGGILGLFGLIGVWFWKINNS